MHQPPKSKNDYIQSIRNILEQHNLSELDYLNMVIVPNTFKRLIDVPEGTIILLEYNLLTERARYQIYLRILELAFSCHLSFSFTWPQIMTAKGRKDYVILLDEFIVASGFKKGLDEMMLFELEDVCNFFAEFEKDKDLRDAKNLTRSLLKQLGIRTMTQKIKK